MAQPRTRRSHAKLVIVALGALLAALAVGRAWSDRLPASSRGVFDSPTDVVLLFSDGIDGVTALDLDRRLLGRRFIEGEQAGDQPFRLALVDDHLVVGWGAIHAAPLDGGPSRKIDDATIYIPAAEAGEVWTIDWDEGRVNEGAATIRRVRLDGTVTFTTDALDTADYKPVIGVPDGLAVSTANGLAVWDSASGRVGPVLGPGPATAVASDGRRLAWCDDACHTVRIAGLPNPGSPTAPHASIAGAIALSPDGRHVAALRDRTTLVVRHIASGHEEVVADRLPDDGSLVWTRDSRQLFVAARAQRDEVLLGRYEPRSRRFEVATVPGIGAPNPAAIALAPTESRAFFAPSPGTSAACPTSGDRFPSGRRGVCSFRF